jgi:hypothetical protein
MVKPKRSDNSSITPRSSLTTSLLSLDSLGRFHSLASLVAFIIQYILTPDHVSHVSSRLKLSRVLPSQIVT